MAVAISMKHTSLAIAAFGILSFVLGIVAENFKPGAGTPIMGKGVVICKYPSDPTAVLGFLSVASFVASALIGYYSIFYPYKGKSVPRTALFQSTTLIVFFLITLALSALSVGMLLWTSITEQLHLSYNIHHNMNTKCPTAKTGLFGGAAFVALDASLFWLICLMLADNARDDYFGGGEDEDLKGEYGQVYETEFATNGQSKV